MGSSRDVANDSKAAERLLCHKKYQQPRLHFPLSSFILHKYTMPVPGAGLDRGSFLSGWKPPGTV